MTGPEKTGFWSISPKKTGSPSLITPSCMLPEPYLFPRVQSLNPVLLPLLQSGGLPCTGSLQLLHIRADAPAHARGAKRSRPRMNFFLVQGDSPPQERPHDTRVEPGRRQLRDRSRIRSGTACTVGKEHGSRGGVCSVLPGYVRGHGV